jgi:hypothetical protein
MVCCSVVEAFFFRERAKGLHVNILEEKNLSYTTQSARPAYARGERKSKNRKLKLRKESVVEANTTEFLQSRYGYL